MASDYKTTWPIQHFKHPSIFDDAFFGPAQLVSALNSTIFWSSRRRIYEKPSSQPSKPSSPAAVMLKMSSPRSGSCPIRRLGWNNLSCCMYVSCNLVCCSQREHFNRCKKKKLYLCIPPPLLILSHSKYEIFCTWLEIDLLSNKKKKKVSRCVF